MCVYTETVMNEYLQRKMCISSTEVLSYMYQLFIWDFFPDFANLNILLCRCEGVETFQQFGESKIF